MTTAASIPAHAPDQRFPRSARLLVAADFSRVFERPLRSADALFEVKARPAPAPVTDARLGLAISRKCARRAVDRNRLKRAIRESFRRVRPRLCGLDLVVLCRRAAVSADAGALAASLDVHWQRLRDRVCAGSPD